MRKRIPVHLFLLSLMLAASALFFVVQNKVAHATTVTLPNPYWWMDNTGAFSQCDQYYYNHGHDHQGVHYAGSGTNDAAVLSSSASYQGVWACGPIPGTGIRDYVYFTPDANATQEREWQCTELVKRFLFLKYGVRSIAANGDQIVDAYTNNNGFTNGYPNLFSKVLNNGTNHIQAGDILSYGSPDNHTAIVTDTSGLDGSGNGSITVLEQNASSTGINQQQVANWVILYGVDNALYSDGNGGYLNTVAAWLHPLVSDQAWSNNTPSGTTYDTITGMAAASTSNIWATGYEQPSGYDKQPVTYHNTGSGWTKISPISQGLYNEHNLKGIAASSAGDAWTVGRLYVYPHYVTLGYHWSGSVWVHVTSDNPSSTQTNELDGVTIDSSGNTYAVGYYYNGSANQPLIEKWNGTKLAQQTNLAALPSGCTSGQLNGVSFSSSTNGWAVGSAVCSSVSVWLVYRYDGTNWNVSVYSARTGLNSVTAVSDNEAWAVGTQGTSNTPFILHYTSANGWVEDTSFNGSYPYYSAALYSVGADSSSDVWIVGGYYNGSSTVPFAMHNLGYGWAEANPPSPGSGSSSLNGVAVNSNDAWAGGPYTPSGATKASPLTYVYS